MLNADFRGKPRPTNVLSWPEEDLAPEAAGAAPEAPEPGDADWTIRTDDQSEAESLDELLQRVLPLIEKKPSA